jgi:hypothetical protein
MHTDRVSYARVAIRCFLVGLFYFILFYFPLGFTRQAAEEVVGAAVQAAQAQASI